MIDFLHTYAPDPVLITMGQFRIHWYGIFIVLGVLAAIAVVLQLASRYRLEKNTVIDAVFYLLLGGIIGARLYHVGLELPYYLARPLEIFKVWQGGLAIHGAIIVGLAIAIWYARRLGYIRPDGTKPSATANFFFLTALFSTGLALAQAIGRVGNYFNQELYGLPTDLPWGIPIEPINRIPAYFGFEYFHPTFLYESIGSLLIFSALLLLHRHFIKHGRMPNEYFLLIYLAAYSILRFSLEFMRIDTTPSVLGLRWPQIISLLLIALCIAYAAYIKFHKKPNPTDT